MKESSKKRKHFGYVSNIYFSAAKTNPPVFKKIEETKLKSVLVWARTKNARRDFKITGKNRGAVHVR